MGSEDRRISGWKSIGAYFGRDRTTAIRWANERGMPVHKVPGGKTATVYALQGELDAWLKGQEVSDTAETQVSPVSPRSGKRTGRGVAMIGGVGALLLAAVAGLGFWAIPREGSAMPRSQEAARIYVEARDAWAQRNRTSLARSLAGLQQVIAIEPDFAPAHAALADAYLLSHEYGAMPSAFAYAQARKAAERALSLDPDLAEAHRALGFVRYWWERDPVGAGQSFRRALTLDREQAQTHFWYANILIDNGEQKAGMREFDAARIANPGSVAIRTDRAWALWVGGDTAAARRELQTSIRQDAANANAHDCLAEIALGEGDVAGYVRELSIRESLRSDPSLRAHLDALREAVGRGDLAAAGKLILARALADQQASAFPDHAFAAFVASSIGDRPALIRILALADSRNEKWGSAGYARQIARRWPDDAAVLRLLGARKRPRMEQQT